MSTDSRRALVRMMVRPRWVLALIGVLVVACGFALLAQWQIGRAVEQATVQQRPTEQVRPLAQVAKPDGPTLQSATAQLVEVEGRYIPGDTVVIDDRVNVGETGSWVVAHLEVTDAAPGGLPVALGWAPDHAAAERARASFEASLATSHDATTKLTARFLPSEAPQAPAPAGDPNTMKTLAVAQLVNVWKDYDGKPAYFAYVVAQHPVAGLTAIFSPAPEQQVELNWLNVFYAAEWVVFAGFAIYLWFRLVKDAAERERDEATGTSGI